jgi:hypothetical protein
VSLIGAGGSAAAFILPTRSMIPSMIDIARSGSERITPRSSLRVNASRSQSVIAVAVAPYGRPTSEEKPITAPLRAQRHAVALHRDLARQDEEGIFRRLTLAINRLAGRNPYPVHVSRPPPSA